MTIHSSHPFVPPESERDPLRRLRGRTAAPVTVWTAGDGRGRAGLTVSSVMIADGDPAHVLGLVDEDSELAERARQTGAVAVSVLGWEHRMLADAFAGVAPAPGGAFRLGTWRQTSWGPVLEGATAWLGARLSDDEPPHAGWALLLDAVVEHAEVAETDGAPEAMVHLRGRYRTVPDNE